MRFRVIAKSPADFQTVAERAAAGAGEPALRVRRHDAGRAHAGADRQPTFQCTNCHIFDDSSKAAYGPNLTHLASRTTFASGSYPLTREQPHQLGEGRAVDDPDVVAGLPAPTSAGDLRGHAVVHREHAAPGMQSMTQQQAEDIADFLLEQK